LVSGSRRSRPSLCASSASSSSSLVHGSSGHTHGLHSLAFWNGLCRSSTLRMLTSTSASPYRPTWRVQLWIAPSTIRPEAVSHASSTWNADATLCDASRWHRTRSERSDRRDGSRSSTTACVIWTRVRGGAGAALGALAVVDAAGASLPPSLGPTLPRDGLVSGSDDELDAAAALALDDASLRLSAASTASLLGVAPTRLTPPPAAVATTGGGSSSSVPALPSAGVPGAVDGAASSPLPAPPARLCMRESHVRGWVALVPAAAAALVGGEVGAALALPAVDEDEAGSAVECCLAIEAAQLGASRLVLQKGNRGQSAQRGEGERDAAEEGRGRTARSREAPCRRPQAPSARSR